MKIEMEISEEVIEKVIRGIMDNFPEASSGTSLICTRYKYDILSFDFVDIETDFKYLVTKNKLRDAFPLLFTDKWPRGCTAPPISNNPEIWDDWLCQADATDFDAFVQLVCLGKVIYG